MRTTDKAWQSWGERDPYFGVLTDDRFRGENIESSRDEFFATGEQYVSQRLEEIERRLGPIERGRALDFGCGVGRLALPLATRFKEVVGVDISPAMLSEGRRVAQSRQIDNVTFVGSDEALTEAVGAFDFVHTYIVLQHIPVDKGMRIIEALADRVAPDGVISLHFSVDRNETPRGQLSYWCRSHVPGFMALANAKNGVRWNEPMMEMNQYPLHKIIALLERKSFDASVVKSEIHAGVDTVVLHARRTGPARL